MKKIVLLLTVIVLFHGCRSALLYTTNNIPIPLVKKQGETQISGQYGTNGKSFNLVSSPLKNISVSIAGNYDNVTVNSDIEDKNLEDKNTHNYTEVAIGYYDDLSESIMGEAFVGYGLGDANDDYYEQHQTGGIFSSKYSITRDRAFGKYAKYFLQANLGKKNEVFTTGFAIRVSYVNFFEMTKFHDEGANLPLNEGSPTFPSKRAAVFFEPAIFAKIGGKNLQLEVEVMFPYTQKDIDFDYKGYLIATGLRFIF